jgi:hypothetical protein
LVAVPRHEYPLSTSPLGKVQLPFLVVTISTSTRVVQSSLRTTLLIDPHSIAISQTFNSVSRRVRASYSFVYWKKYETAKAVVGLRRETQLWGNLGSGGKPLASALSSFVKREERGAAPSERRASEQ